MVIAFQYHTGKEMVIIAHDESIDINNVPEWMFVDYEPDMFFKAKILIAKYGYAIAKDNEHTVLLKNEDNTYVHSYCYSGGADMWFLDQYDCIFLHDCNEFSVELCQSALRLWKGKRLVLVGSEWQGLIPMLPDIACECWYEEVLTQERLDELTCGFKSLHIVFGIPHAEFMDRYNEGIMYYDEVMALTFMFSDYRELGNANDDKNFFVLDAYYGNLGLFAILQKVETCVRYAKIRGFIPVISLKRMGKRCFYSDFDGDDVWEKFFNQPEKYSLEEVMNSRHVYFSPGFYNGSVMSGIMDSKCGENSALDWPYGLYNQRVSKCIYDKGKMFLPHPDQTLGVLARGTDYVKTHLLNHPIHASLDMLCKKIDESLEKWNLKYIYVATEDASYCRYLKERYADKIYFTDQERYEVDEGEMLSDIHRRQDNKRNGFDMGMDYILSIDLLSKCNSLIASGECGGLSEALRQNEGKYKNTYVFELGINQ